MKELTFVDYYGMCDANGKVLGHISKITREYADLLKDECILSLIASPCICNDAKIYGFNRVIELPYDICADFSFTLWKRIKDKYKLLKNIRIAIKGDERNLFFLQVDFFFFFYLWLCYKRNSSKKIYCLIYHQNFVGGRWESVLQNIYRRALSKIDGVFYTQKNTTVMHNNSEWIPDYYFDSEIYGRYIKRDKLNQVACLGTMNRYKQLEKMIEVWNDDCPKLIVAGRFDQEERYIKLRQSASSKENIIIRNEILSEDEYYTILGSSKYSIMPYDMEQYKNRTSGVIQESIFLGSIPIAPKKLIEQNGLCGIGYDSIKDIYPCLLSEISNDISYLMNTIKDEYSKEYVKCELTKMFL